MISNNKYKAAENGRKWNFCFNCSQFSKMAKNSHVALFYPEHNRMNK